MFSQDQLKQRFAHSGNGCVDVENQCVPYSQLHLSFTVSDVSYSLHLVYQLLISSLHSYSNTVKVFLIHKSWLDCLQNCLADRPIYTSILKAFDLEDGLFLLDSVRILDSFDEVQIKFLLALEILSLIPLYDGIFKFTDTIQVTVDFL